jgi:hypothetical protein
MGEIVNLRQERKRKARKDRQAQAAENRSRFGVPKAQRDRRDAEDELQRKRLDALKRETPDGHGRDG